MPTFSVSMMAYTSPLVFREKSDPSADFPGHEGSTDLMYAEPYTPFATRSGSGRRR